VPAELAVLPSGELARRLAGALELVVRLRAVVESKDVLLSGQQACHVAELALRDRQIQELTDRVAQLERQVGRDGSNSSRACLLDQGTGSRSQILIAATSTVPRQT
jgi:hypothetical protein